MNYSELYSSPKSSDIVESNTNSLFADDTVETEFIEGSNATCKVLYFPNEIKNPDYSLKSVELSILDQETSLEKIQSAITDLFANKDNGESVEREAIEKSPVKYKITLPLSNVLQENNRHMYEEQKSILASALGLVNTTINTLYRGTNSANMHIGDAQGDGRRSETSEAQLPNFDAFKWQSYAGTALRDFTFTYRWIPRSSDEANQMMRILYILKKYSYPFKTWKSQALRPPPHVKLKFNNPLLHALVNPGICVLEQISFDYTGGDDISTTLDGIPRRIEFNMTLKEYRQKYANDFDLEKE